MDKNERLTLVQDLLNETNQKIKSNSNNYIGFLHTAGNNFKYTASEQKLIYAQKPDATAVAMSMVWFKRFRRAVNQGTKAIWLLSYRGANPSPYYVFDISDTHSLYREGFALWQAQNPEYIDELQNKLKEHYDVDGVSFTDTVFNSIHSLIEDESDSSQNFSTSDRQLVEESVKVMVSARCEIDYESDYIHSFNISELTTEKMNDIIMASSYYSSTILTQIEQIVHESIRNILTERSKSNGRNNVYGQDGSTSPEHSNPRTPEDREVRNDATSLPNGTEARNVYDNVGEQHPESTSGADRQTGEGTVGKSDRDHAEESGRDRGAESSESNVVGSEDEQHSQLSGGNRPERADIQLNNPEDDKAEVASSALSVLETELLLGSGIEDGKYRIYDTFKYKDLSIEEKASFLKDEFGWSGRPGTNFYINSSGKGLSLSPFGDFSIHSDEIYSWKEVAQAITRLVDNDLYLTYTEKENYDSYQEKMRLREQRSTIAGEYKTLIHDYTEAYPGELNRYALVDCASGFVNGERKCSVLNTDHALDFVIVLIRNSLLTIIERNDPNFTDRSATIYNKLLGSIAEPFELTNAEKNLVEDYENRNYVVYPGDKVNLNNKWVEVADVSAATISVRNPDSPLIADDYDSQTFYDLLSQNSHNHKYLYSYNDRFDPDKPEVTTSEPSRVPTVTCVWSEHPYIKEEEYSILVFDELTAKADFEWNNDEKLTEIEYVINYPDGRSLQHSVTIGEKKGGFLASLEQYPSYSDEAAVFRKVKIYEEYQREQKNHPDSAILSRIGDFYEVYGTGAEKVSAVLNISLTHRRIYQDYSVPMTGFPVYQVEVYRNKLSEQGVNSVILGERNEIEQDLDDVTEINNNPIPGEELIGTELQIDDRSFTIENVKENGDVTLRDITFQNATGFPIFRSENLEYIYSVINEQKPIDNETPIAPQNYKITSDTLGVNTPKNRFRANVEAIKTLKKVESENRQPTEKEKDTLATYVGWGGLSEAFDSNNTSWSSEYTELTDLLSPEEYEAARSSTLSAFYTQPIIIKTIYSVLDKAGFSGGRILEPSCGIGNFFGLLPDSMIDSQLYGVELDDISGRIAQALYPNANIQIKGFERTSYEDNSFDVVIGNVPFGDFKIVDRRYNKQNFLIHDYFFAKALDKVRSGGIVAFITYKGTLDKKSNSVRKYIAQRAVFLGAVRLPNTAFKDAAGTDITADIIFLQKRERIMDVEPYWTSLDSNADGIVMNAYFTAHPEMIVGHMEMKSGRFGEESTCKLNPDDDYTTLLNNAASQIKFQYQARENDQQIADTNNDTIPADPFVKNFSYTLVDNQVYFRNNDIMIKQDVSGTKIARIKGLLQIRDTLRTLIDYQLENYPDDRIKEYQNKLNVLYDNYVKKYGRISSRGNSSAFSEDSSYYLLSSLEVMEKGEFQRKADIFTKRTIQPAEPITHVDTSTEALNLSIAEYASINMEYMERLTDKTEEEIVKDLRGVIFKNPRYNETYDVGKKYLTSDEYLSGNVRTKLAVARAAANENHEEFDINVAALERVQPEDLTASEISVRLGSTWVPIEYYEDFMYDILNTPINSQRYIHIEYSDVLNRWSISGKSTGYSVASAVTFGTTRINGYSLMEHTLNLQEAKIYDTKYLSDGTTKRVLNNKETTLALAKQDKLKQAFLDWIWKDPMRRQALCKIYNNKFNSVRPREYDGSHIIFPEMNPEITLRKHQRDAIARILYGGNTLLAHVVGAGKTFEMVAAAQESHRLGLSSKAMFVVPNHIIGQFATEYLQLYPAANILVATKNDFTPANRKKFCSRIATGDYDSVIIGHSQFEKIPMSIAHQQEILQQELDGIIAAIENEQYNGNSLSVKRLETMKRRVATKLDKLNDQTDKDDVITFEELGVDMLFVDEAHYFKNLATVTKMGNVSGISQTEAKKSSDLYLKCRYLDGITGGRGIVFATGTPISNSMVELFTMQRYLQYSTLERNNLLNFDSWASVFGETVNAIELDPTGNGYRNKTRFSRFYNLPELITIFKEIADIKTADMVQLDVPAVERHNIILAPSEIQQKIVKEFDKRADRIQKKQVDRRKDNMLCVTNDGRNLALDQRMIDPDYPDSPTSKATACAENVYNIWRDTSEEKLTQMIFCDLATPKKDGSFSVYNDIKAKLIVKGIPESEIQFIHDAETDAAKNKLYDKVRTGEVRVLMGSTRKLGAGTNVQSKLIALHHLDCPWRPSDLQQREGRIIRQGNNNKLVHIYTYVTEKTFDSYLYQMVERKQKFIGQIMTSKAPVRIAEDIDEQALSYAEIKALCSGNPLIKERMELENEVSKLKVERAAHQSTIYSLEDDLINYYPKEIAFQTERVEGIKADLITFEKNPKSEKNFTIEINNRIYLERKPAGEEIIRLREAVDEIKDKHFGSYRGFDLFFRYSLFEHKHYISLHGACNYKIADSEDKLGTIMKIDNAIENLPKILEQENSKLQNLQSDMKDAEIEIKKPFEKEEEYQQKSARLEELTAILSIDKDEHDDVEVTGVEPDIDERNII